MLKVGLFLLISCYQSTFSCPFVPNITVTVNVTAKHNGFHPELRVFVFMANLRRFLDCSVAYKVTVPAGAFLDLNTIRDSQPNLYLYAPEKFDIEAPKETSKEKDIFVCSHKPLVNSFLFDDSWTLPLNLRYHSPSTNRQHEKVRIPYPEVLIRCEFDEIPQRKCQKLLTLASCDCESDSDLCSYVILPTPSRYITFNVPIGDKSQFIFVLIVTFIAILICFLFVCFPVNRKYKEQ